MKLLCKLGFHKYIWHRHSPLGGMMGYDSFGECKYCLKRKIVYGFTWFGP